MPVGPASDSARMHIFETLKEFVDSGAESLRSTAERIAPDFYMTPDAVRGVYYWILRHPDRAHWNRKISYEEELRLCQAAKAYSMCNTPLSKEEFLDLVKQVHPELSGSELCGWYEKFRGRWSDRLCVHSTQGISASRVSHKTLGDVLAWVEKFPSYIDSNGLSWKHIINADKTRVDVKEKAVEEKKYI